jgi:hypothetical protein
VGVLSDGVRIASESLFDNTLRVWDIGSGECLEVAKRGSSRYYEIRGEVVGGQGGGGVIVKGEEELGYDEFVGCFGVPPFLDGREKTIGWFTASESKERDKVVFLFLGDGSQVLVTPPRQNK